MADDLIEIEPDDPLSVRCRRDAMSFMVDLVIGERGPECPKWEDFKTWCDDAARWMENGEWPKREAAKLKQIKGGKDAPQAQAGQ